MQRPHPSTSATNTNTNTNPSTNPSTGTSTSTSTSTSIGSTSNTAGPSGSDTPVSSSGGSVTASTLLSAPKLAGAGGCGLEAIFDEFETYPFSDDRDFKASNCLTFRPPLNHSLTHLLTRSLAHSLQAGLPTVISAIRGNKRSAAQIDEMIARAQWFYFCRIKNLSIPFDTYVEAQLRREATSPPRRSDSLPGSSASSPLNNTPLSNANGPSSASGSAGLRKADPISQLNSLAEAKRMMSASTVGQGDDGMSFAMLCELISEGRAGEVSGVKTIPDQINDIAPSRSNLQPRLKPWERSTPRFDSLQSTISPTLPTGSSPMPSPALPMTNFPNNNHNIGNINASVNVNVGVGASTNHSSTNSPLPLPLFDSYLSFPSQHQGIAPSFPHHSTLLPDTMPQWTNSPGFSPLPTPGELGFGSDDPLNAFTTASFSAAPSLDQASDETWQDQR